MKATKAIYVDPLVYSQLRQLGRSLKLKTSNNVLRHLLGLPMSKTKRGPKRRPNRTPS